MWIACGVSVCAHASLCALTSVFNSVQVIGARKMRSWCRERCKQHMKGRMEDWCSLTAGVSMLASFPCRHLKAIRQNHDNSFTKPLWQEKTSTRLPACGRHRHQISGWFSSTQRDRQLSWSITLSFLTVKYAPSDHKRLLSSVETKAQVSFRFQKKQKMTTPGSVVKPSMARSQPYDWNKFWHSFIRSLINNL